MFSDAEVQSATGMTVAKRGPYMEEPNSCEWQDAEQNELAVIAITALPAGLSADVYNANWERLRGEGQPSFGAPCDPGHGFSLKEPRVGFQEVRCGFGLVEVDLDIHASTATATRWLRDIKVRLG